MNVINKNGEVINAKEKNIIIFILLFFVTYILTYFILLFGWFKGIIMALGYFICSALVLNLFFNRK